MAYRFKSHSDMLTYRFKEAAISTYESSRNTDPTVALVVEGTAYKIGNVDLVGELPVATPVSGSIDVDDPEAQIEPGDTAILLGGLTFGRTENTGVVVKVQKYITDTWVDQSTIFDSNVDVTAGDSYTFKAMNGDVDMKYIPASEGQYRWLITITHLDDSTWTSAAYFEALIEKDITFAEEALRNTNPGVDKVQAGIGYKILNVDFVGEAELGGGIGMNLDIRPRKKP